MSPSKTRADELMESWLSATARPVPAFTPRQFRRRPLGVAVIVLAAVALLTAAGVVAIGGFLRPTQDLSPALDAQSPAELAASSAGAIADAPGVRYVLTVAVDYGSGDESHLDSSGEIDFEEHRFSGIADGGGGSMVLFGGPSSGAVVVADGLFVRTGAGSWEHIADPASPLDRLIDPDQISGAVARWIASSEVDPTIHGAPCEAQRCQVVRISVPPRALSELAGFVFGQDPTPMPSDLAPISADLYIDSSGFPVGLETVVTAGETSTAVSLRLTRLDPAPTITPPIP